MDQLVTFSTSHARHAARTHLSGPQRAALRRWWPLLRDGMLIVAGILLIAIAVNVFLDPNDVVPGGFTALAIFANRLWGWPTGLTLFVLNIPFLLLGMKVLGREFGPKTLLTTLGVSLAIDLTRHSLPIVQDEPMLYVAYGGLLYGLGMALIFRANATSGGTEIPAKLLKHFRGIRMAQSLLTMDMMILGLAALFFGLGPALYSLIVSWVMSRVIEFVDNGLSASQTVFIITEQPEAVRDTILADLGRGVTLLQAQGGYTGESRPLLFTVLRRREVRRLRALVSQLDPNAFVVISPSRDVLGEGFATLAR